MWLSKRRQRDRRCRQHLCLHHYLEPARYSHAAPGVVDALRRALGERGKKCVVGPSWTTDAPYRETASEVREYQKEGVLAVEMEAAALFAVAEYRGAEMGVVLAISDSLADLKWDPMFHDGRTKDALNTAFEVALDVLHPPGHRPS